MVVLAVVCALHDHSVELSDEPCIFTSSCINFSGRFLFLVTKGDFREMKRTR